jgi:phosphopantetheinyl transferase (holo-ACP synthase)
MVGNDIVDLNEAQKASNWQRQRFLTKLFSETEQVYIKTSKNPFLMVWRLWSMKEASYKLFTQLKPGRFYNPKGFECSIEGNKGVVEHEDFKCYVESKSTSNYVISEARLNTHRLNSTIVKFATTNHSTQSTIIKSKLLDGVEMDWQLKKDEYNIPVLTNGEDILNVSLTHHGNYGAYTIA